jgi:hypothetical protein
MFVAIPDQPQFTTCSGTGREPGLEFTYIKYILKESFAETVLSMEKQVTPGESPVAFVPAVGSNGYWQGPVALPESIPVLVTVKGWLLVLL